MPAFGTDKFRLVIPVVQSSDGEKRPHPSGVDPEWATKLPQSKLRKKTKDQVGICGFPPDNADSDLALTECP
jgi:hypothetical protein